MMGARTLPIRICRSKTGVRRIAPAVFSFQAASLVLAGLILTAAPEVYGQRDASLSPAPAALLDVDSAAAKMLGAARDFLAARQYGDAVELLRQIAEQHGERVVAIESARYVNVQTYVDILVSNLPPEGLKLYRDRVDPQARRWFESARRARDEAGLERVVRKALLSSYGDDALLLLGDLAWEQGLLARARGYWQMLVPPNSGPVPGELPQVLKYPDSDLDPALIRARLVLCSLMQGKLDRAQAEVESFHELYPRSEGTLASQRGNLAAILKRLVEDGRKTKVSPAESGGSTFAGNSERNQVLPKSIDVGGVAWSVPLKEVRVERAPRSDEFNLDRFERAERMPAGPPIRVLSYFPVAWKNVILYCSETEIFAWDLTSDQQAKPAWGGEAVIYRLPQEFDAHGAPSRMRAGLPRFTLSVDRDRLFARLGAASAPAGRNRPFRNPASVLVCLDLARQGDLAWIVDAEELESDGGRWTFDGAPLPFEGRVYVPLRRSDPQLQLSVACLDAANGKLLWNRKVCAGVEPFSGDVDEVRHQILTLSDERIYYGTNLGAIVSLEARDGALRWAATYPRAEIETIAAFNRRQLNGPNPCLYHDGLVFVSPVDGDRILALDAESGALKWQSGPHAHLPELLGIAGKRLVAAGDLLWGIDAESGRVEWIDGRTDPEAATAGRGLLAGDVAYWPRREEIRLVEISTGRVLRQVDLHGQHGLAGGGNLSIAGEMLLLAQADRLVAFSQFGVLKKPSLPDLALRKGRRVAGGQAR